MSAPVLRIRDLTVSFRRGGTTVPAVSGLDLTVPAGGAVGIVGESGSGKSVTSLAVLRLLPSTTQVTGSVEYGGRDLLTLTERQMRRVRGKEISLVFQEPMTSLNPLMTIGAQVAETIALHEKVDRSTARRRAVEMLDRVRLSHPDRRYPQYPHELSGGMRQRVMIAIALACRPAVLIADEPTTALDVTVQAEILGLLSTLRSELGTAIVLISHDMGVIAQMCDDVVVMNRGAVVEHGAAAGIFAQPRHPYTRALLAAMPAAWDGVGRLGEVPVDIAPEER